MPLILKARNGGGRMEQLFRIELAVIIFVFMSSWEYFSPRRKPYYSRLKRWPTNMGLAFFNMLIMRVTLGGIVYLSVLKVQENTWGLLNQFALPLWANIIVTLLLLDLAIYCQHVFTHKCTPLWRLHQVHHSDLEFDASTAVRFHPLEILLSMAYKIFCIVLMGAEPLAVIVFEILLNGAATFNHSNINIPLKIDQYLRWVLITPDTHRIHHSTVQKERDSNYGFSISLWDRLFKTYLAEPENTQITLEIGLTQYRNPEEISFMKLLSMPFKVPLKGRK